MSKGAFASSLDRAAPRFSQWLGISAQSELEAFDAENTNIDAVKEERLASGLPVVFQDGRPLVQLRASYASLAIKRGMDILLSLIALMFLGPFLVAVAVLIRMTSPGPALFRQYREGQGGKIIAIYKFRSMHIDQCDDTGIAQTRCDDERITPIGRFIRKTSIDELPQLINILKGDMSIIGPRPHVAGMVAGGVPYKTLVPYYNARLAMRPGLSGWAQANGYRGPTDNPDLAIARIDHDLAYIANFSLWLDLKIIVLTLAHELAGGSGN